MITSEAREQHVLSCRNISLFSTINGTSACSRILTPPPVAQFIKEISLKAYSGEVFGVIGAPGSGKSTLLEAISCRGNGDVTGSLQLNHNILSRERFNSLGSFVSSNPVLFPVLPVRSLLYYTSRLHLGGLTTVSDIHRRVNKVMSELEIVQYAQKRPSQLSRSARRRLCMALAVVKDPLLIVLDDVLHGLDSLSSFHLLTCLSTYAKKNNRIVVLSLRSPRSDLYHLLDRVAILFYGETFFTGRTKDLPGYFREAGFPCPATENPAMYYLTLSTIDRETPQRFAETQEQAVSLVASFKEVHKPPPAEEFHINRQSYGIGSTVALCYLEKPTLFRKFLILVRRNLEIVCSSPGPALLSLVFSPILAISVSFFAGDFSSRGRSVPHSANGLCSLFLFLHSGITVFTVNYLYSLILPLSYKEYWENVVNQSVQLGAFVLLALPFLCCSSFLSGAILLWRVDLFSPVATISYGAILLSAGLISQGMTLSCMLLDPGEVGSSSVSLSIFVLLFAMSGSIVQSLPSLASSWLNLFSMVNPLTYTGHLLSSSIVAPLQVNCTRTSRLDVDPAPPPSFCRWKNGLEAYKEKYPEGLQPDSSVLYLILSVSLLYCLVLFLHSIRKPVFLIKRFL